MIDIRMIGLIAGFLTTVSFVPQIRQLCRACSAKDLSLGMYRIYTLGVAFWLAYGIASHDFPIIFWNGIALILSCVVLILALYFDRSAKGKGAHGPKPL